MLRTILITLTVLTAAAAVAVGGASAGSGPSGGYALVVDGREVAVFAELDRSRLAANALTLRGGRGDAAALARVQSAGGLANGIIMQDGKVCKYGPNGWCLVAGPAQPAGDAFAPLDDLVVTLGP